MDILPYLMRLENEIVKLRDEVSLLTKPETNELIFFKQIRKDYHMSPATLTRKIAQRKIDTVQPGKEKAIRRKDLPKLLY